MFQQFSFFTDITWSSQSLLTHALIFMLTIPTKFNRIYGLAMIAVRMLNIVGCRKTVHLEKVCGYLKTLLAAPLKSNPTRIHSWFIQSIFNPFFFSRQSPILHIDLSRQREELFLCWWSTSLGKKIISFWGENFFSLWLQRTLSLDRKSCAAAKIVNVLKIFFEEKNWFKKRWCKKESKHSFEEEKSVPKTVTTKSSVWTFVSKHSDGGERKMLVKERT